MLLYQHTCQQVASWMIYKTVICESFKAFISVKKINCKPQEQLRSTDLLYKAKLVAYLKNIGMFGEICVKRAMLLFVNRILKICLTFSAIWCSISL